MAQPSIPSGAKNSTAILTQAIEQLSLALDLSSITAIVSHAARELLGADGATFVLREDEKCFYVDEDAISALWKGRRFPVMACISGWSMIHRETVVIPDIYLDSRIPHDAYRPTFVKSLCMVPIRFADPIGAIGLYWSNKHTPSEEQVRLIQILANNTVVALENRELKGAAERRQLEKRVLTDKNMELELLIQSIAHDLKNPLTAILGLGELLKIRVGTKLGEQIARVVSSILKTSRRLNCQIDKMLALYRMENRSLNITQVDLTSMARDISEEVQAAYPQRDIRIHIEENMMIMGDRDLIRIALDNFFSNSVKYSQKKPFTEIIFGRCWDPKGEWVFFIKDNGDGFSQGDAHKLFQPLSRLHNSKDFSGNGIGLVSVAKIIKMHEGKVWAQGTPGNGASFFFSLPRSASDETAVHLSAMEIGA